jgi:hypothetical protein
VSGAVAFQFGCGRVPAIGLRIAFGRESIGVAIIIELLLDGKCKKMVNVQVPVPCETVITVDNYLV